MQNNAGGRHKIHAYPVTVLYKARKNRRDYYMELKTLARSLARSCIPYRNPLLHLSEQPQWMKYSIIRRYYKLDSLFQRSWNECVKTIMRDKFASQTRKNNNTAQ